VAVKTVYVFVYAVNRLEQWSTMRWRRWQQLCDDPDDVDSQTAAAGAHTSRQHAWTNVWI